MGQDSVSHDSAEVADLLAATRVVLLTRVGCHLCEVAQATVEEVCREAGVTWSLADLDALGRSRPDLLARYTDEVPVTFVDGIQHDYWRVDRTRLRAALGAG